MSAFPENSSSALQVYCHQEGVKVNALVKNKQTRTFLLYAFLNTCTVNITALMIWFWGFVQDVIIPELMKKLDILGDNGVSSNPLLV